jgi:hypothetical protein
MVHNSSASHDFSKRTLAALAAKGLYIVGIQMLSTEMGDCAYLLSNGCLRTYFDVLDISEGK